MTTDGPRDGLHNTVDLGKLPDNYSLSLKTEVELLPLSGDRRERSRRSGRSRGTRTGRGGEPGALRTAARERAQEAAAVRQLARRRLGGRCPVSENLLLGLRNGLDLGANRVVKLLEPVAHEGADEVSTMNNENNTAPTADLIRDALRAVQEYFEGDDDPVHDELCDLVNRAAVAHEDVALPPEDEERLRAARQHHERAEAGGSAVAFAHSDRGALLAIIDRLRGAK